MASIDYLTAFEHQKLRVAEAANAAAVSAEEAERLRSIDAKRPGFCERGFAHVALSQYCGLVSMGSRLLEVLPKTDRNTDVAQSRGTLLQLLRLADALPLHAELPVGQSVVHAPLLEVFISEFLNTVADLVRGGLLVEYRECEDDLPLVRGRVQISAQLTRHANRGDRVTCCYDDLTADNPFNQVVKCGLWLIKPVLRTESLFRRWTEVAAAFVDVSVRSFGLESLRRLTPTRQSARYRIAIDWIGLFIQLLSPDLRAGSRAAPALLFDMNKLFEQAVANHLRSRVHSAAQLSVQESRNTLAAVVQDPGQRLSQVQPDLVVRRGKQVVAVGDTKWKILEVNRSGFLLPLEADLYQALAYAVTYGSENIALIYPWHSGLSGSRETTLEIVLNGTATRVSIICLDVRTPEMTPVRGGSSPFWKAFGRSAQQRIQRRNGNPA